MTSVKGNSGVCCSVSKHDYFLSFLCSYYDLAQKDHVTNEEVHGKIKQAIWPHEDLLTIVKRCKLKWYGYVSRSSGLAKTILQSTGKGGRRQGWQKNRWKDNIMEWTRPEFAKSQRAMENREKWRKLVVKWLRDRWKWRRRKWQIPTALHIVLYYLSSHTRPPPHPSLGPLIPTPIQCDP